MKTILITTDDRFEVLESKDLNNLVGGYFEIVSPKAGYRDKLLLEGNVFLCDEDGLNKEKLLNYFGTLLYNGLFGPNELYPIVGDIVIAGSATEGLRDLTDEEIYHYKEVLKILRFKEVS